ncbi:MAG TPA: YggS family pyridoxal phosphate-dependent enzyme [Rhodospirillales bacterium]|nr:YggS family pyridoxal phosphate-dependent enzyme [Rhodospirillales bacterium]
MTPSDSAETSDIDVAGNLAAVQAEIAAAARAAGRAPEAVTLVVVTKTHLASMVARVLAAGQRVFGENRVQEAESKWPALKSAFPGTSLHLIGPLQRNKVRRAVRLFDVVDSIDRPEIARAVAEAGSEEGRTPDVFVQVNTGEEPQKAGVFPEATDSLVTACRDDFGLRVRGLMCIPPLDEEPSLHFALLREIARRNDLSELSMGMSADFAVAVRFGATHVRVGTAIFGRRPAPAR